MALRVPPYNYTSGVFGDDVPRDRKKALLARLVKQKTFLRNGFCYSSNVIITSDVTKNHK